MTQRTFVIHQEVASWHQLYTNSNLLSYFVQMEVIMQDINIFLPMNCGSGNRGCEAIAKGTSKVLSLDRARTFLYDFNKEEMETDIKLGLNSVGELRYYASNTLPNLSERAFIKVMNLLGISIFNSNI